MSHLEALEEVIRYQKEKLAIQEAKILQLEADLLKAKSEPKIDYLSYLEKQRNCQHEYRAHQGLNIFGGFSRKCRKCDYYEPSVQFNTIPGGQQITNIPNGQFSLTNPQVATSAFIQQQPALQQQTQIGLQQGNLMVVPESERNRG